MVAEQNHWARHWFLTLTYRNTDDYNYETVQRYLHRVRKATPDKIRYVCTTEFESKGERDFNPHHHLIIYTAASARYKHIAPKWQNGFYFLKDVSHGLGTRQDINQSRLHKPAHYIAKYLVKQGERVRASQGIGKGGIDLPPPF